MKAQIIRIALCLLFSIAVSACGGGGSSSGGGSDGGNGSGSGSGNGGGTGGGQNETPIELPDLLEPEYTGSTSDFIVTDSNTGETVISTLRSLDLLNQIVFNNEYGSSLFIESGEPPAYTAPILVCETGTNTTTTDTTNGAVSIVYTNCLIEGDTLTGTTVGFVDASPANGERTVLNIDLTIASSADNSSITLQGNIVVTALGNIVYNLTIDDGEDVIWFDNLIARVDPIGLRLYFVGDIYLASNGKLAIDTSSIERNPDLGVYDFNIELTGTRTLNVTITQGNLLTIDSAGFSTPLRLDLLGFEDLPSENILPTLRISASESVEHGEAITIDASLTTDPNLTPLNYSWALIDGVMGADVDINTNGPFANIVTDMPGTYSIGVTVTDPLGGSLEEEVAITFKRRPPVASINLESNTVNIGSVITGDLLISSPQTDGPFEYALEYAPEGFTLNNNGTIEWIAKLPNLGQALKVDIGIRVTSPDHSIVTTTSVEALPTQSLVRTPINPAIDKDYKFALNTNSPILLTHRSAFDMQLANGTVTLTGHALPDSVAQFAHGILHIADIDSDGDLDYLLTQLNPDNGQHKIMAIDASGNQIDLRTTTPPTSEANDVFDIDVQIMDLTDAPGPEILLFNRNFGSFFEVIGNDGSLLSEQGPPGRPWCDVNNDGKVDWIQDFQEGYRLFDDGEWTNLVFDPFVATVKPRYTGLSSTCNIYGTLQSADGQSNSIVRINPITDTTTEIADLAALAQQFGVTSFFSVSLTVLNTDNDSEEELAVSFLSDDSPAIVVLNNIGTDSQTASLIDTSLAVEGVSGITLSGDIFDIDNDGIDETISQQGQFQADQALLVNQISNAVLNQSIGDIAYAVDSTQIPSFDGNQASIYYSFTEALSVNISDTETSKTQFTNLNFGALVSQEGGEIAVYEPRRNDTNNGFVIEKQDVNGNTIWEQSIPAQDNGFLDYTVGEVNEDFVILKGSQPVVIERSSGDIAYRFPVGFNSITINDNRHLISTFEREQFLLGFSDTGLHAVQLTVGNEFAEANFDGLNNLFETDFIRANQIQLNTADVLELVVFYGAPDAQKAIKIDLSSQTINELPQSVNENIGFAQDSLQLISHCMNNSAFCTTSIYGQMRGNTNDFGNIFGVDSITGQTVWQTTQPFVNLKTLAIHNDGDNFKTMLVLDKNIVVVE